MTGKTGVKKKLIVSNLPTPPFPAPVAIDRAWSVPTFCTFYQDCIKMGGSIGDHHISFIGIVRCTLFWSLLVSITDASWALSLDLWIQCKHSIFRCCLTVGCPPPLCSQMRPHHWVWPMECGQKTGHHSCTSPWELSTGEPPFLTPVSQLDVKDSKAPTHRWDSLQGRPPTKHPPCTLLKTRNCVLAMVSIDLPLLLRPLQRPGLCYSRQKLWCFFLSFFF